MKESIIGLILMFAFTVSATAENRVCVNASQRTGKINRMIFGTNFIAYDPNTYEDWQKEYYGYSDFGAGMWDPSGKQPVKQAVELAVLAGVTNARFPGGCGAHHYDWKKAIGRQRQHFLFGIDEFLKTCLQIGAEPVITLSYFQGNAQDAADLVEYLNLPAVKENPWAIKRSANGSQQPYGVKYFEFGNEDWHGDHRKVRSLSPEEYAQKYLEYYRMMKKKDPSIKIGAILLDERWNRGVLSVIKDNIDFGIVHVYPSANVPDSAVEQMDPHQVFQFALSFILLKDLPLLQDTLSQLKHFCAKDVPLAITEYNAGFVQDKPVAYRHCLGSAVVNAEFLRVITEPSLNILMANYWQFCNSYWGMIKSADDFITQDYSQPANFIKRPNFYLYEFLNKHFAGVIVETKVDSECFDASEFYPVKTFIAGLNRGFTNGANLLDTGWKITELNAAKVWQVNDKLSIFFRSGVKDYFHSYKTARVEPNMYYKMEGFLRTSFLKPNSQAYLEVQDSRGWDKTKSSAASEFVGEDEQGWKKLEAVYQTLPDSEYVNVLVRKTGPGAKAGEKIEVRDLTLRRYFPAVNTMIPYISACSSVDEDERRLTVMVINKSMDRSLPILLDTGGFVGNGIYPFWTLRGSDVDANNEGAQMQVQPEGNKVVVEAGKGELQLPPHSVTFIEIKR